MLSELKKQVRIVNSQLESEKQAQSRTEEMLLTLLKSTSNKLIQKSTKTRRSLV